MNCTQGLLLLQEQFHFFSCLSEDSRSSRKKSAASDVTSGFLVNPKSLEPQEKSLADLYKHHIMFSEYTKKTQQKLWRAKLVCLPSAMYCLQTEFSVGGRVSFLIASKEVLPISRSIFLPWLM